MQEYLNRDEVLEAIKVFVEEHGEVPGRRTFLSHYSVPVSAFDGTYFTSWGSAVREAGFQPIESLERIPDEFILKALADLILQIDEYPSQARIRMHKKTVDPEFPSRSMITKRLGSRPEQIKALLDWCCNSPKHQEVAQLLHGFPEAQSVDEQLAETQLTRDGYVYLLQSGKYYKIGMSQSVPRRWSEISAAAPEPVDLIHYFRTDDPAGIESYWHRRFASQRHGGEWFTLSTEDIKAFKRRIKFM